MEFIKLWMRVFIFLQGFSQMSRVFGESGRESVVGLGSPYFQHQEAGLVNVTTQLEATTYLHCRVNRLGGKTVSWLKRIGQDKDPHLLTYGRQTYSSDARFQIIHEKPNNWKLQIQFTKKSDVGLYECQVSTNPPLIQYTYLNVVVPTIKIVDERHQEVEDRIFYDRGSTIKLKCMVEDIVGEQPEYIIWKKGNRMLNYDTERGGISVRTDLLANGAQSRLHIAGATFSDSGNYTCMMGRTAKTQIELQIIPGETAEQVRDMNSSPPIFRAETIVLTLILVLSQT
eukprot:TRINITY_DN68847_c0_g1_i1.p1 TRINITY_DN68847_c0_g1~~TRINITY_DN68847_c0_g1_i1.p1  ORF type:complete len:285 (-),score=25.38 TRINITY_DN68847_c0_g1_i1:285-1139(-)